MTESIRKPEEMNKAELTDDALEQAAGGETVIILNQPMEFKICAANSAHVYPIIFDACPECGTKEYTIL